MTGVVLVSFFETDHHGEVSQATIRTYIIFAGFLYFILHNLFVYGNITIDHSAITLFIYTLFTFLYQRFVHFSGVFSSVRHAFIVILDVTVLSYILATTEAVGALFYPLYLWLILGNGTRFGLPFLYFTIALSIVGFSYVLTFNTYWEQHTYLGIGMIISLIILPLFYVINIKHLHMKNRALLDQLKNSEQRAHTDSLTGLPNRDKLLTYLKHLIDHQLPFHLLFIDLDNFKNVNDTHGHKCGDDILRDVSSRMKKFVSNDAMLARLGGDEFAFIIQSNLDHESVKRLTQSIIDEITKPYFYCDHAIDYISASIGITHYHTDSEDVTTLLHEADKAMYAAKHKKGKYAYAFWDEV
jgi:diguanylate cyclase (GGDEF)-like protein